MKNKPGYSWGPDLPVNLFRTSKGWLAVYYHTDDTYDIIKIFHPKNVSEHYRMMKTVTLWNYGTCELCPAVRAELDWVS